MVEKGSLMRLVCVNCWCHLICDKGFYPPAGMGSGVEVWGGTFTRVICGFFPPGRCGEDRAHSVPAFSQLP